MAKLIEKKSGETVYTLELTEGELVRLVAYCGVANFEEAEKLVNAWGIPAVPDYVMSNVYSFLKRDVLEVPRR